VGNGLSFDRTTHGRAFGSRGVRGWGWCISALLALVLCVPSARAQLDQDAALLARAPEGAPQANEVGPNSTALCGLVTLGLPTCPKQRVTVAATTGYGYTESLGAVEGSHSRIAGVLAASYVPLPWLALALTLDGRIDIHPNDALGSNKTATGEPRLLVRAGRSLPKDLSVGGELVLWFPGNDAPSFEPSAISADLKSLLSWTPKKQRFTLLTNLGFRLDNSANSAPDLQRVRPGDRVALGLSDSHAFLFGVGGAYRVRPDVVVFGEVTSDMLFGSKAPRLGESPWRVSAGARYFFPDKRLSAELNATVLLSGRPGLKASDPLVPTEPRFFVSIGLRYNAWEKRQPTVTQSVEKAPILKNTQTIGGLVLDDTGAPLPEATVKLAQVGAEPGTERETVTNASGRYTFEEVAFGRVSISTSAVGFQTQTWESDIYASMPDQETRQLLLETSEGGLLRGLVRSFGSTPLKAQITVINKRGRQVARGETDDQGRFEIALSKGTYRVVVSATGYKPHRGEIQISENGVAILNVDMRQK
jgi:hypothetical protein